MAPSWPWNGALGRPRAPETAFGSARRRQVGPGTALSRPWDVRKRGQLSMGFSMIRGPGEKLMDRKRRFSNFEFADISMTISVSNTAPIARSTKFHQNSFRH